MPRLVRPFVACAAAAMLLTACGQGPDQDAATKSTTSPASAPSSADATAEPDNEPAGTTLRVTVEGNELSPKAEQVKVAVGEEIALQITSDREGEFHVHSTPEQTIPFGPGKTTAMLKFGRPGVVDVEEHDSHKLLVKFEVR